MIEPPIGGCDREIRRQLRAIRAAGFAECVGEAGESRAALDALSRDPDWRDRAVVQLLSPELKGVDVPAMKDLLEPGRRHFIPPAVCARLGLPVSNHAAG